VGDRTAPVVAPTAGGGVCVAEHASAARSCDNFGSGDLILFVASNISKVTTLPFNGVK